MSICRFIPIELHVKIREYPTNIQKCLSFLTSWKHPIFFASFILWYANQTVWKISEVCTSNNNVFERYHCPLSAEVFQQTNQTAETVSGNAGRYRCEQLQSSVQYTGRRRTKRLFLSLPFRRNRQIITNRHRLSLRVTTNSAVKGLIGNNELNLIVSRFLNHW